MKTVRRSIAKAGSYRLTVSLTLQARKTLKPNKKLNLKINVGYVPALAQGGPR